MFVDELTVKMMRYILLFILIPLLAFQSNEGADESENFKTWATKPPMGWNSYNCYGAAVKEAEVKANAEYMAEKLKEFGWEYIVVDYCWSYPHPPNSIQNNPPQFRLKNDNAPVPWLAMDNWGRLLPDPNKFPSAACTGSFKELADYIHSLGLKFGIHVMRGIPRQAVWAKSPIKGTNGITADRIADTVSICPWLNQMYGLDMSKPGAQEYYNSLAELYAEWGVDYIKMDDVDLNEDYPYHGDEAEAMHNAIIRSGRKMVLSLSLNMKLKNKKHIKSIANSWRISKDFWDDWRLLKNQFALLDEWTEAREPGNWPDADMLQLGWISRRGPHGPERESNFTKEEQITHVTLWCIAKSPLMMGGDMPDNSPFVEHLLTADEVLAVNQKAIGPKQLYRMDEKVVWTAKSPDSEDVYVAFFNLNDSKSEVKVAFKDIGLKGKVRVRDLWQKKDIGIYEKNLSTVVNAHGAKIYKVIAL